MVLPLLAIPAAVVGAVASAVGSVAGAVGAAAGAVGGAVGSAAGAVGGAAGAVGAAAAGAAGTVVGEVGSVAGAVGGVVGSVAGEVGGAVGSVAGEIGATVGEVGASIGTATAEIVAPVVTSAATVAEPVISTASEIGGTVIEAAGTAGEWAFEAIQDASNFIADNITSRDSIFGRIGDIGKETADGETISLFDALMGSGITGDEKDRGSGNTVVNNNFIGPPANAQTSISDALGQMQQRQQEQRNFNSRPFDQLGELFGFVEGPGALTTEEVYGTSGEGLSARQRLMMNLIEQQTTPKQSGPNILKAPGRIANAIFS